MNLEMENFFDFFNLWEIFEWKIWLQSRGWVTNFRSRCSSPSSCYLGSIFGIKIEFRGSFPQVVEYHIDRAVKRPRTLSVGDENEGIWLDHELHNLNDDYKSYTSPERQAELFLSILLLEEETITIK